MSFVKLLRFVTGTVILSLLAGVVGSVFLPQPAHAAGEVFTWKDYRTITVSGGDLRGTSELILSNNPVSGDIEGIFAGTLLYNKGGAKGCTVTIQFYIFKSNGNVGGRAWHPGPYDGPILGDNSAPPTCWNAGEHDLETSIHDKWFDIGGTRPASPEGDPERPEEKLATIDILAPDPMTKAPKTVTITIKQGDKVIATQTVPFKDDSGAADWPPDQTPVRASATFTLEPGDYTVCDNYVIPKCEKFTKVKKEAFDREYGNQFKTPEKRQIEVHVAFHTVRPCGASLTVGPVTITLKRPDDQLVTQQTDSKTVNPKPAESNADCNVDVYIGLDTTFKDMPPGEYEACATGAECVKFTKKPDQGAQITLNVETTLQPPEDQKVCTSGDGIAGIFAIFICPFTEIIAKSTDFFEKNIIIPFMTVSPLTTNADNPIYILWQNFRNLANIGFIIFFFAIIFSQATSIGISIYGLKRMLSKVFFVAVALNLSYFGAAFIVDAFNIFGGGVSQLVDAAIKQAGTSQINAGSDATPVQSVFVLGGVALAAILLSGGAILGWLFNMIMLAALIIIVVVLVLMLRQVLIIMLVILSPIAILLYMLPNTENYFQKWRKTLIQLLLMYPMIVLLFASGKLFGMILQQPGLIQTGGGISDQAAEAIRVILQFIVYILPLAFLPATFAASGTMMTKAYGWANNRFISPRGKQLGEDASQMGSELRARVAKSGIPGVSAIAGNKYRRDYTRESRKQNVQRAQEEYMAQHLGGSGVTSKLSRRAAAGVAGQAGQTRAAAGAANVVTKALTEDLKAENALLNQEMRRLGMDEDTFAAGTAAYLEDPTNQANQVITGANGQTFNFAQNETKLQRALLNSAASQGYVRAIEAARTNENIDQNMVDDIIRRNDGELRGKGGYHLATNFSLAAGRMQVHDPTTGALRAPASKQEMETEIRAQRLIAMSQTGLDSIAGMKTGLVMDSGHLLATSGPLRDSVLRTMDHAAAAETAKRRQSDPGAAAVDYRATLKGKMDDILSPRMRQTIAKSDNQPADFANIRDNL